MIVVAVVLGISILGYIISVLVDQITKPQQADGTMTQVRPGLIFFYTISTIIFIGSVLISLGFVIWITVKLVRQLRHSSSGAGVYLQNTTTKAVRKIVVI